MAFIPPQGNQTVMVDNSNNIVYPAIFNRISVNQATIAGNNFTSVPSVIDPENATTTQMPSVASVVSYVADVVEGGSSGLIPAIQSDIQSLGQVKSNRGELWFNGGRLACANKFQLNTFSCVWTATLNASDLPTGNNNTWIYTCRHVANSTGFHVGVHQPTGNVGPYMWLQFYYYDSTNTNHYISKNFITDCYDGKPHTFAVIFNGGLVKFLIDNEQKLSVTLDYEFAPRDCSYPLSIGAITHRISRIKYFNFDMSSDDAPYTLADYMEGKEQPPIMNTLNSGQFAQLSLDDYSIRVGATQIVPDVSSSNNDATITGSVMGSKDTSIAKMAQLFYQSQQG